MWKTGHAPMKAKMRETGAAIGGEISGHIYFGAPIGYDDALLAAIRLIAAVRLSGEPVAAMVAALPNAIASPEARIPCPDDRKFAVIEEVIARLRAAGAVVDLTDGARVTTPQGWWLLRASNTEAALTARAEAENAEALAVLLAEIDAHLSASGVALA
jgi:phosphomannomutase